MRVRLKPATNRAADEGEDNEEEEEEEEGATATATATEAAVEDWDAMRGKRGEEGGVKNE